MFQRRYKAPISLRYSILSPNLPWYPTDWQKGQKIQSQKSEKPNKLDSIDTKDTKSILEQWTDHVTYGIRYEQYFGMTMSLLRLNKNIYSMAKNFLDNEHDWIVFGVDFQHYILSWIQHLVLLLVIFDRDESKFMKVPEGIIERVDLSDTLQVANCVACKGVHRLNVLIHVQPDQRPEFIKPLLSLFKMLHGPLHALSIIGFEDTDYTRVLEESIAQPRSSDQVTLWEVVSLDMWVLTLAPQTKGAGPCSERSGD
ncbi:hypothetical protein BS50DRAFT_642582 [Corynespora cassiicola Philippines]|uniref:Uncharacterized protein n=1 Tax=Corynespora cassiicola Philippines TaxID=1448308 RepID=A0A2T2P9I2_CORCC|nr:hypothetical protein BS50DRAFT_642582 [Corynespora cassiicola Philippines]